VRAIENLDRLRSTMAVNVLKHLQVFVSYSGTSLRNYSICETIIYVTMDHYIMSV